MAGHGGPLWPAMQPRCLEPAVCGQLLQGVTVMKKLALILAAGAIFALFPPAAVNAQTAVQGFQILSFDIGYAPSWEIGGNGPYKNYAFFGLNVRLADRMIVGFQEIADSAPTYHLLSFKYQVLQMLRATLAVGSDGSDPYIGFGFEAVPFSRNAGGSVATEFKLAFQYLANPVEMENGTLLFALAFGVGM
jgi:hypothetical protein